MKQQNVGLVNTFRNIYYRVWFVELGPDGRTAETDDADGAKAKWGDGARNRGEDLGRGEKGGGELGRWRTLYCFIYKYENVQVPAPGTLLPHLALRTRNEVTSPRTRTAQTEPWRTRPWSKEPRKISAASWARATASVPLIHL